LTAEENDIQAIARFHYEFLKIHPFLDGNGRTARALLLQQCLDLFGRANLSRLDRGASYNSALIAANGGDLVPLIDVIRPVLEE
jgi:Fic family protein